jgi:hypothetical protein
MSLPDTLKITVTADDIAQGTPESWSNDPIARAVKRAVGPGYRVESAQYVLKIFEGAKAHSYALPLVANQFWDVYDDHTRHTLSPFSFTLTRFTGPSYRVTNGVAEPIRWVKGKIVPVTSAHDEDFTS